MPPTRYRTGTAQTVLLGLVFFCVPGMWNSITSMAGGLGDARPRRWRPPPRTRSTPSLRSSRRRYASLGARATLFLGSLGYSVYVASLLLYHLGVVPSALVAAAGALNGVCAGLLWVANGVLLYTYAGVDGRGFLFGVFWVVFNLGAVVGGVLSFAENFEHTGAKASTSTFATFLSLMVLGALLTLRSRRPAASCAPTARRRRRSRRSRCAPSSAMGASWLTPHRRARAALPLQQLVLRLPVHVLQRQTFRRPFPRTQ